ncbi:12678_t:CDS:2 [Cetraspora pellucida]|uniref:12678_t:CDS:1 n=1 Tax=Cetraspora pellucida TaxID=1433469 RepID=A0A9N9I0U1_9GLOM|nr:12678_t:CDS:2 [Cetraspora pellucida]
MTKGATQGIRVVVDNWLYSSDKVYEQAIRKELDNLCPNRMERYNKVSKWEALYSTMLIRDNTSCSKLECELYEKIYKRHSGLAKHKKLIQDANTIRLTIYELPERAIEET